MARLEDVKTSVSLPPGKTFTWVELAHFATAYAGIPSPAPWPPSQSYTFADDAQFPYETLIEGIDLLVAEFGPADTGVWPKMKTIQSELPQIEQALQSGDLTQAEGILRHHLNLVADLPMQCFNLAFILGQRGDHESARQLLQTAARGAPNCYWIWVQLGTVCETLQRKDEAIAAYQKALALVPTDLATKQGLHRLKVLCRMVYRRPDGQEEEAFVTRDKMLESIRYNIKLGIEHRATDLLLKYARQFIAEPDPVMAEESVRALLTLDPADETARVLWGDVLRVAGKFAEAETHLNALGKEFPKNATIPYTLAWVAFDRKQHSTGWLMLEETLDLDPNHGLALSCKFKLGSQQKDEAVEKRLVKWSAARGSGQGMLHASLIARQRGDARAALLHAEQAYKLTPTGRNILVHYAGLLKDCDNNELAAAVMQPVLRQGETDPFVKMQFAGALHRLGLKAEALKLVDEVLAGDLKGLNSDLLASYRVTQALWSGERVEADVALEFHSGRVLRRPIYLIGVAGKLEHMLDNGLSIPSHKLINFNFTTAKAVTSVGFQQGKPDDALPPTPLGYFILREMNADTLLQTGVLFALIIDAHGKLQASAKQAERTLPIEWSMYPAPTLAESEA